MEHVEAHTRSGVARPLVKGSALREFALWYEGRHGRAYVSAVLGRLVSTDQDLLWPDRQAFGLVASDWYPVEVAHAILDAIAAGRTPDEMHALVRDASEFTVRRLTRGLYQYLFRMVASPNLYAKHVQRAWRTLHTTGTRRVALTSGVADSTIEDWPGHHPWLCLLTMETMRSVFLAMRCHDVELTRVECMSEGGGRCRALLRYREPR